MTKAELDYYTSVPQQLKKMAELLERIYDEGIKEQYPDNEK